MFSVILSSIISFLGSYIFICNISSVTFKVIKDKKKVFYYILLNLLFLINLIFQKDFNKILINLFILFIFNFLVIFENDYKKSIFFALIFFIFSPLIELVTTLFSSSVFKMTISDYEKLNFGLVIFSLINTTFVVIISYIPIIKKICKNVFNTIESFKINLYLAIIVIYIFILSVNNLSNLGDNPDFYINVGVTILIILSSFIVLYILFQKNKIEDKYNEMLEYVSKYEKIINEQGKRNHEFNNQLMVLEGYINNKTKLKEYLKSIINEQKGGQNYRIKQLSYIPDGGIKGLIYYKIAKMEEKKIKFYLYVDENIDKVLKDCSIENYRDITKILGVFLDNAIDASKDSKDKEIEINLFTNDNNTFVVEISNSFEFSIDLSKIGKKGYTSKGKGHGFGLSLVKDISYKNKKIEVISEVKEKLFKQTLMYFK